MVIGTEEFVGDTTHVVQVVEIGADSAEYSEDGLHKKRGFGQATIDNVCQVVEVSDVVALVLETSATPFAKTFQDRLDVTERVAEDAPAGGFQVGRFPVVLPFRESVKRREQAEVHRPHVQRTHFRLQRDRALQALIDRHVVSAAGCHVDDRVGLGLDRRQKLAKHVGIWRGPTVVGVAGVQVKNAGTSVGCSHRVVGNLLGCHRQVR